MWEYLTLYSVRDDTKEAFFVKHHPEPRNKTAEDQLLNDLGNDGWELVAVVPAYGGSGMGINHQLYLKRRKSGWGDDPQR